MKMKYAKRGLFAVAFFSAALPLLSFAATEPFKPGERVVFLGDSITHGSRYVGWLQLFQNLRHPGCGTTVMSAGKSGGTAGGCLKRFARDVAGKRPDRVFVMFGMNDVGHGHYVDAGDKTAATKKKRDEARDRYSKNMEEVDRLISGAGAQAVYMTPTPYDEYATDLKKPANKDCNEYGLFNIAASVRKLAASKKRDLIELFDPFTKLVKKHPGRFMADRVHPGDEGHLIMAAMVFGQTGASPFVGKCTVEASDLPFEYRPASFPLPLTSVYRKAEEVYPITEKLNREIFAVKGLESGSWELLADGKVIGRFSSEELAEGVNLAVLQTPNQLEAQRLAKISGALTGGMSKMCTFFAMFDRVSALGGDPEKRESAFSKLDAWVKEMQEKKVATAAYYASCVKSFKKTFDERPAIEKLMEEQRAELNAARPRSYVISVRRSGAAAAGGDARKKGLFRCQVHRGGGRGTRPDNALESFLWCWGHGVSPEADARLTKDGVAIALHDPTLKRTGRGFSRKLADVPVENLNWSEICDVDIGSYLGKEYASARIATMDAVFAAMARRPGRLLYLDEKGAPPEMMAAMAKKYGVEKQIYYTSSDFKLMARWQKEVPGGLGMVWLGTWPKDNSPAAVMKADGFLEESLAAMAKNGWYGISQVQIHIRTDLSKPDPFCPSSACIKKSIGLLHSKGITVQAFTWTEGANKDVLRRIWDLGFDNFATDDPLVLFELVSELK